MQINKINSQPNFQAVNQKYFEWEKRFRVSRKCVYRMVTHVTF